MRQHQLPRNDARTEEAAKALNDCKHSWAADFADAKREAQGSACVIVASVSMFQRTCWRGRIAR